MRFKAIFFDRDGTLLTLSPDLRDKRNALIEGWSGKEFHLEYPKMMDLFDRAGYPKEGYKSVEEETAFWRRYWWCASTPVRWRAATRQRISGSAGSSPESPCPSSSWSAGISWKRTSGAAPRGS